MAFMTKTDWCGLAITGKIVVTSDTENKSAQTVNAKGEDGFVVATEVFGETAAPANDYAVIAEVPSGTEFKLGKVTTVAEDGATRYFALNNVTISTSAGAAPTISGSATQVESATAHCTATFKLLAALSALHHAQTFGAFTLGGKGAHVTSSTLSLDGTVNPVTKDGEVIASDLDGAQASVQITVQVSDAAYGKPTLTPADGWVVTSPLTRSNTDAEFPSWTATLVKQLAADAAEQ